MIKIGKLALKTGAPDEARLLSSSGCSAAEMRRLLAGPCLASTIAAALLACATGEQLPRLSALATAIADAGCEAVRRRVLKLYQSRKRGPRAKNKS